MQPNRPESPSKAAFRYVAENLYRREVTGVYYAFAKSGRKQFRHSLKTTHRELAKHRLRDFLQDVAALAKQDTGGTTFDELAKRWRSTLAHAGKESSAARREQFTKALAPFFAGCPCLVHTEGRASEESAPQLEILCRQGGEPDSGSHRPALGGRLLGHLHA